MDRTAVEELLEQYARSYSTREDEPRRATRARSEEADIAVVAPEVGAALEFFTRMVGARHVAEVGTGGGYSGLWLLAGMEARSSLTTVEHDPQVQALAQRAFADAKVTDRVRSMLGPALVVLPRLADGNYDLVFLDATRAEYADYLEHAKRLLRDGGLLLAHGVSAGPQSSGARISDQDRAGVQAFGAAVTDDAELVPLALPLGNGLLAAIRVRPPAGGANG